MRWARVQDVELDDYFDQAAIQHRETQGHESLQFTKLFKEITTSREGFWLPPRRGGTQIKKLFRAEDEAHRESGRGALF